MASDEFSSGSGTDCPPGSTRLGGWASFGLAIALICLVWLVVLPRLETHPMVRARIDHLERHGIDPAALFYTDLEAMPRWEASIRAARLQDPDAFWGSH